MTPSVLLAKHRHVVLPLLKTTIDRQQQGSLSYGRYEFDTGYIIQSNRAAKAPQSPEQLHKKEIFSSLAEQSSFAGSHFDPHQLNLTCGAANE